MEIRKEVLSELKKLLDNSRIEYSHSGEPHEDGYRAESFLNGQRFSIKKLTKAIQQVGNKGLEAFREEGSKGLARLISPYVLEDRLEAYFSLASEILEKGKFSHQIF